MRGPEGYNRLQRPSSSGDRAPASGAGSAGSIPAWGTRRASSLRSTPLRVQPRALGRSFPAERLATTLLASSDLTTLRQSSQVRFLPGAPARILTSVGPSSGSTSCPRSFLPGRTARNHAPRELGSDDASAIVAGSIPAWGTSAHPHFLPFPPGAPARPSSIPPLQCRSGARGSRVRPCGPERHEWMRRARSSSLPRSGGDAIERLLDRRGGSRIAVGLIFTIRPPRALSAALRPSGRMLAPFLPPAGEANIRDEDRTLSAPRILEPSGPDLGPICPKSGELSFGGKAFRLSSL